MKKSSDTIGNRSRDLPVCSAVPQPQRHRVSLYHSNSIYEHLFIRHESFICPKRKSAVYGTEILLPLAI
jgi:hypothetical protein